MFSGGQKMVIVNGRPVVVPAAAIVSPKPATSGFIMSGGIPPAGASLSARVIGVAETASVSPFSGLDAYQTVSPSPAVVVTTSSNIRPNLHASSVDGGGGASGAGSAGGPGGVGGDDDGRGTKRLRRQDIDASLAQIKKELAYELRGHPDPILSTRVSEDANRRLLQLYSDMAQRYSDCARDYATIGFFAGAGIANRMLAEMLLVASMYAKFVRDDHIPYLNASRHYFELSVQILKRHVDESGLKALAESYVGLIAMECAINGPSGAVKIYDEAIKFFKEKEGNLPIDPAVSIVPSDTELLSSMGKGGARVLAMEMLGDAMSSLADHYRSLIIGILYYKPDDAPLIDAMRAMEVEAQRFLKSAKDQLEQSPAAGRMQEEIQRIGDKMLTARGERRYLNPSDVPFFSSGNYEDFGRMAIERQIETAKQLADSAREKYGRMRETTDELQRFLAAKDAAREFMSASSLYLYIAVRLERTSINGQYDDAASFYSLAARVESYVGDCMMYVDSIRADEHYAVSGSLNRMAAKLYAKGGSGEFAERVAKALLDSAVAFTTITDESESAMMYMSAVIYVRRHYMGRDLARLEKIIEDNFMLKGTIFSALSLGAADPLAAAQAIQFLDSFDRNPPIIYPPQRGPGKGPIHRVSTKLQ